jgi:polar amino acid transport system permease protein
VKEAFMLANNIRRNPFAIAPSLAFCLLLPFGVIGRFQIRSLGTVGASLLMLVLTVLIFALTLLFSLPLGMIVYFGRSCKFKPLSWIVQVYISIMRGTPLILQIMFVYFGPYYIFGIQISPTYKIYAVFISFVINYAAYFAEIYRGGIESMPVGQYEAAKVLGYTKSQTFMKIILPQVVKRILPSVTNEVITLVKDTSLAFTVGVMEMFTVAKALASAQANVVPYIVVAVFYYVFNFVVALVMECVEKKFQYYR